MPKKQRSIYALSSSVLVLLIAFTPLAAHSAEFKRKEGESYTEYSKRYQEYVKQNQAKNQAATSDDFVSTAQNRESDPLKRLRAQIRLTSTSSTVELCKSLANIAEVVMIGRQDSTDILDMYEVAETTDSTMADIVTKIVTDAYDQPAYSTEEFRDKSISEYKSSMMVSCMKARS